MEPPKSHLIRKSQTEYNKKPHLANTETSQPTCEPSSQQAGKREATNSSKTEEVTIRNMKPNPDQTEQKKKPEQTIFELSNLQAV